MVEFSGWELPVQFEGVLAEHRHCRSATAVFDTAHMGVFRFSGPEATAALSWLLTQNAAELAVGRCRYGFLLNPEGGVLDDCILERLDEANYLLVVNAGTRERDAEWIQSHLRGDCRFRDLTSEGWAKIDVQGPRAFETLRPHLGDRLAGLGYFGVAAMPMGGAEGAVSRTGYTGELGYELMGPADVLRGLLPSLLEAPEVRPAGLGARDSLRLEMGYPLYGHELAEDINPVEADAGAFVRFDHAFMGAEAVRAAAEHGPERRLVAFRTETRRRSEPGDALLDGEGEGAGEGHVTSGAFCPSLGVSAGLGFVPAAMARPGRALVVRTARTEIPAVVADRPLYRGGTCRTKID